MSLQVGHYDVGGGEKVIGELALNGSESRLTLRSKNELPPYGFVSFISGTGVDGVDVTCVQCVPIGQGTDFGQDGQPRHWLTLFPHYVAIGEGAVDPDSEVFDAVEFTTNDLAEVCFEPGSSGAALLTPEISRGLNVDEEKAKNGGLLVYFNGPQTIAEVETQFGRVLIQNAPTATSGNHGGVSISNRVLVRIDFEEALSFREVERRMHVIRRFLSVVAGRNQVVTSFKLRHKDDRIRDRVASCVVTFTMSAAEEVSRGALSHWDLPLHPTLRTDEFSSVLQQWVERDPDRLEARVSFHDCYIRNSKYTVGRLVAAANMFDLLPDTDAPNDVDLAGDLASAVEEVKEIMRKLPDSPQRNSILGAVGRIKKASLPLKVQHRWEVMSPEFRAALPDMSKVLKFAIQSRNHFVHGSPVTIPDEELYLHIPFLTDALEFVFMASDLSESGWNADRVVPHVGANAHPFTRFKANYPDGVARLKAVGAIK
ncbi:hypothetical protein U4I37_04650 [Stenotrophomonas maltophilia]|uniref:ApeA N-terminal domain 1-containing protein n=1 Tax=Stenotrophomonas maltophilia TaxID=40324 RepID=UPI001311D883|nr:hypothetical protein [Stenotrophomonas maltophilia]MCU1208665.1 hypothetical protein [Stenotrophomonas maltophilia]MDZ5785524.1 hypothetical protein [Stenotrophomonas maltophilia]HDS1554865.1 hypothetical protein [Stenotrophomonas maltophilia]